MKMEYNYTELTKFKLAKGIKNIYKHMKKTNPNVIEDMKFSFFVLENEDGLCLNVIVTYPSDSGLNTWRNYRIDKDGKIITWVQEHRTKNKEANNEILKDATMSLAQALISLNLNHILIHVGNEYDMYIVLKKVKDKENEEKEDGKDDQDS